MELTTPSFQLTEQWNDYYRTPVSTPWEMIDFRDLPSFLRASKLPLKQATSLISIGCGRGHRDLEMLREIDEFNSAEFFYSGVDISSVAIAQAKNLFGAASNAAKMLSDKQAALKCQWEFIHADLFEFDADRTYEIVLDWMCMHDIEREHLPEYARKVAALARDVLVLKVFSEEGSSVENLGLLGRDIQKLKISSADVLDLYGDQFEIAFVQEYEENLNPEPRPQDGIEAAKRAYVLRRLKAL